MAFAAATAPAPRSRTFAALLEEYAAPSKLPPERVLDDLEDDVATLSYENALKAHARYHREPEPAPAQSAMRIPMSLPQETQTTAHSAPRKSASVTVRLTASESEQLHARAAEAGLTVSAYLRSCAFEVETLRAQVKEAVARMKQSEPRSPEPTISWMHRVFMRARKRA